MRHAIPLTTGLLALSLLSVDARAQSAAPAPPPGQAPVVHVEDQDADSANEDATALAKKLQNPVGDLYSFPFQNNTNFNTGPNKGAQDILNVQPVIPIHINEDWNVITRTILPLVWQPSLQPAQTVPFGAGPTTFSAFLSPKNPTNGWLWAVGPVFQLPTISNKTLGSPVWGGGPTGVLVYMKGPWVAGVLVNNVWSFGGTSGRGGSSYNMFLTQPFVNYNFGEGWYAGTSPIITSPGVSQVNICMALATHSTSVTRAKRFHAEWSRTQTRRPVLASSIQAPGSRPSKSVRTNRRRSSPDLTASLNAGSSTSR